MERVSENSDEMNRRVEELLQQAAADGLLGNPGEPGAAVVTDWALVFDTRTGSDGRWLRLFSNSGQHPWVWRGLLRGVLDLT